MNPGKNGQKNMTGEFYDYWLSTHGFLPKRTEPKVADWALDINFTNIDRESGRFDHQDTNILYHGTIAEIRDDIELNGLRTTEGAACFTRRVGHALDGFAVMGNYTMITNGSVDGFIQKAAENGTIDGSDLKERAKNAFEYWCQNEQREKLGLITIWDPPKQLIALDAKERKVHKRHFALYQPKGKQSATERRKGLSNTEGEKIYLNPEFLRFIARPQKALRDKVAELESAFAHGKDIINDSRANELRSVLEESAIDRKYSCDIDLALTILVSICEAYLFDLVRANTESLAEGHIPHSRLPKLENLAVSVPYLENYRKKTVQKIDQYIKDNNLE
jgi:hypothetical protein